MTEKNILLIDDEETIQEVVQVGIQIETGWQVAIAFSGLEGINLAANQQPDAILLDVMMPGMDGLETCRRLKARDGLQTIPVIFVTAKTDVEDLVRGDGAPSSTPADAGDRDPAAPPRMALSGTSVWPGSGTRRRTNCSTCRNRGNAMLRFGHPLRYRSTQPHRNCSASRDRFVAQEYDAASDHASKAARR